MRVTVCGGPLAALTLEQLTARLEREVPPQTGTKPSGSYPKLTVVTRNGKYGTHSEIRDETGRLIADVFGGEPMAQLLARSPQYLAQLHLLETTLNMGAVVKKLFSFGHLRASLAALAITLASNMTRMDMERFRHIMGGTR